MNARIGSMTKFRRIKISQFMAHAISPHSSTLATMPCDLLFTLALTLDTSLSDLETTIRCEGMCIWNTRQPHKTLAIGEISYIIYSYICSSLMHWWNKIEQCSGKTPRPTSGCCQIFGMYGRRGNQHKLYLKIPHSRETPGSLRSDLATKGLEIYWPKWGVTLKSTACMLSMQSKLLEKISWIFPVLENLMIDVVGGISRHTVCI